MPPRVITPRRSRRAARPPKPHRAPRPRASHSNWLAPRARAAYHAFYHLAVGAPDAWRAALHLGDAGSALQTFNYFTQKAHDAHSGPGRGDAAADEFAATSAALVELAGGGASGTAKAQYFWARIAGILHLGQVRFEAQGGDATATTGKERAAVVEESRVALQTAAALFDVTDVAQLEYALCNRTIGGTRAPRTPHEALAARDALAKAFYEGLLR